jgi:hypothetical protein
VRQLAFLLAALSITSIGGCILFGGFDELAGNNGDDAASDATGDDAGSGDASAPDASTPSDASAASDGPFCANKPDGSIYCEDFDDNASVASLGATSINAVVTLENSRFLSAPRAMECTRSPVDSGVQTSAHAQLSTNTTATIVRADFDVLASPSGGLPLGSATPTSIFTVLVNNSGTLELTANQADIRIIETDSPTGTAHFHGSKSFDLGDGQWHRVRITLDMSSVPASVRVDVGPIGGTLTNLESDSAQISWTANIVGLKYGLNLASGPSGAADVVLDNILIVSE